MNWRWRDSNMHLFVCDIYGRGLEKYVIVAQFELLMMVLM